MVCLVAYAAKDYSMFHIWSALANRSFTLSILYSYTSLAYCHSIAYAILQDQQDAEESVNDTYMDAWNTMPPNRPSVLSTFLGKITRRISIDRWRIRSAKKRGGDEVTLALDELEECVSGSHDVELQAQRNELIATMHRFLDSLPDTERRIFLLRYWYLEPIQSIANQYGFSQSKVASMLHRVRGKLRNQLEKEGYV